MGRFQVDRDGVLRGRGRREPLPALRPAVAVARLRRSCAGLRSPARSRRPPNPVPDRESVPPAAESAAAVAARSRASPAAAAPRREDRARAAGALVARLDDPSSRLLNLRQLEPHLDSEARNLNRQARSGENAPKQIGTVEQISLVPEQRNLLPPMLHLRHGARIVRRVRRPRPEAIGVGVARRAAERAIRRSGPAAPKRAQLRRPPALAAPRGRRR